MKNVIDWEREREYKRSMENKNSKTWQKKGKSE